jgi:hypothetical protein
MLVPPRFRIERELALEQILRQPVRTALTTGVLVVAVSNGIGLGHAIRDNVDDILGWYARLMRADWVMTRTGAMSASAASKRMSRPMLSAVLFWSSPERPTQRTKLLARMVPA